MTFLKNKLNIKNSKYNEHIFDKSTVNIIIFASFIIIVSVLLMGGISYSITKDAIVQKLKSKDLLYITESITSKIDGRIARAKETSLLLARDPVIINWVTSKEKDKTLGEYSKKKITDIAKQYDYSNSFIVSALTNHYWSENGKLIDTMSPSDPDDSWFFSTINANKLIDINIDYNNELKDSFVFINALIYDSDKPIAVTGVGLNLKDISEEFKNYKFGEQSNMWLINKKGDIYLSEDIEHSGKNISNYIPNLMANRVLNSNTDSPIDIFEYKNNNGEVYDVISEGIRSTDWRFILQIPRSESTSVINSIMINTIIASLAIIALIIFIFYSVSNKIANPYKRAIRLSKELEKKVLERTRELNEKNTKIMDSIEYAKIIQNSIIPPYEELNANFTEHFVLWKPRDIVSGDFYFAKKLTDGYILVVGDCTGHGVPGALMTMTANSILNNIVEGVFKDNPALILKAFNRRFKETMYGKNTEKNSIDDGLDAGVVYISNNNNLIYAGAKITLYKKTINEVIAFKGDNKGIGYRNTTEDFEFKNFNIDYNKDDVFYISTDGFVDQNGGEKDFSFGKKRLEDLINKYSNEPLKVQQNIFDIELKNYMGNEDQRDDILLIAFKPLKYS